MPNGWRSRGGSRDRTAARRQRPARAVVAAGTDWGRPRVGGEGSRAQTRRHRQRWVSSRPAARRRVSCCCLYSQFPLLLHPAQLIAVAAAGARGRELAAAADRVPDRIPRCRLTRENAGRCDAEEIKTSPRGGRRLRFGQTLNPVGESVNEKFRARSRPRRSPRAVSAVVAGEDESGPVAGTPVTPGVKQLPLWPLRRRVQITRRARTLMHASSSSRWRAAGPRLSCRQAQMMRLQELLRDETALRRGPPEGRLPARRG